MKLALRAGTSGAVSSTSISRQAAGALVWSRLSTAPASEVQSRRFQVTHPYHPLFSHEFELVVRAHNWREDRVWFHAASGRLSSLPADWTSIVAEDPFVAVAAGRASFRVEDLLELVGLIRELKS